VNFYPTDKIKEQIYKLSMSEARTVKFVDRTFNCDENSLQLLSRAAPGRIQLEIGLQSFHAPTLAAVQRKTDLEKAEENIRRLMANGNIHVHVDLIAGLPQENLAAFEQGFGRAYALGAHKLQLGFLKLLHGSELRSQAQVLGLVYQTEPLYEIICSPWMSESDLALLRTAENALQHTYNQGRFLLTLRYVLSVSLLSPLRLFYGMGSAASHRATPLEDYAAQLYAYFRVLPNVQEAALRDHMLCDFLSMTKGKSMPGFLKSYDKKRKQVLHRANQALARCICANEAAVLGDGRGVYVDSQKQDLVTKRYPLTFVEI
jgi:hypothetical protein